MAGAGKDRRRSVQPHHVLPLKCCVIDWAIQTRNYITFLNNRHFLPEVLLFSPPFNPEYSNETVLRSKLADNVALFFLLFSALCSFLLAIWQTSPSHKCNLSLKIY